ncbi:CHAP domain-containing protein [Modestobacter sp. VKM Ac-2979]|uniref:CHAP domain-containing protein n=1 Tax=unclassified Modestobacter TaxID=2643866 RepID=UPI0022ABBA4A|nr:MULTISPECIES: CHAP domain-containing protein [unclassified Modestobacter]MCZ2813396.1 CHAP domain-containing protein [Modestobacter sp. VKM Ac-2979]MCZ2842412.1 CHAP domain-containing protein [Modestobacter sp. VKM Ac-2980]
MIDPHGPSLRGDQPTDPDGPDAPAPGRRPVSRRSFLLAGGAVLAGGAAVVAGLSRSGQPEVPPVATPPPETPAPSELVPGSLDAVLAEAGRTAGRRLLGSPWRAWFGETSEPWSAIYVTWLLRENGVQRTADPVTLYAELQRDGRVGSDPEPGALVFYSRGEVNRPHHVGLVTSVTRGVPQTVEGDHPFSLPYPERFVRRYARPWEEQALLSYGYPAYA